VQALSLDVFGINEWAVRLPSWLATLASLFLVYQVTDTLYGKLAAQRATLIYGSCGLVFIVGGAVLTDPFFALGTTLCMVAPVLVSRGASKWWGYGFFVGLAVGLLSKGPLVLCWWGRAAVSLPLLSGVARLLEPSAMGHGHFVAGRAGPALVVLAELKSPVLLTIL